ncbi:MAG: nucleotidyltransferase [Ignavibacteria bacterium]
MEIFQDLKEFVELLRENKVEYMVIDGYAMAIHSRPKYTKDLDIWINNSKTNARRVKNVLDKFGTGNLDIKIEDLTDKELVIQLGFPPVRIDILKDIAGLRFKEAYKKKVEVDWGDLKKINFISLDDLIKNKKETGREKDLDDIKWIKKYSKKKT